MATKESRLFATSLQDHKGLLNAAYTYGCQVLPNWANFDDGLSGNFFTGNSEVSMTLDPTGEFLIARWKLKSLWDPNGTLLSEDELFNSSDVIGWMSMVKTDMVNAGVKRLAALFQGSNIFPKGEKPAIKDFIESVQVFRDFHLTPVEVRGALVRLLTPVYAPLWKTNADRTKFHLKLEGIGIGSLVARVDGRDITVRLCLPIRYDQIGKNNKSPQVLDLTERFFILLPILDILLLFLLDSIIFGYLIDKVPVSSLHPSWMDYVQK